MDEKIVILDFGGQYAHLLARRIREMNVYSEILPNDTKAENLKNVNGIILSGGPGDVYESEAKGFDPSVLNLGIPVLGLCYGHQQIAYSLGGDVKSGKIKEYGLTELHITSKSIVFGNLTNKQTVWMSHGDTVEKLPSGFVVTGSTPDCKIAAYEDSDKNIFGLQFHPEVTHTENGMKMLHNFVFKACKCKGLWDYSHFIKEIEDDIIAIVGNRNVFLLVSGGVDSSVCFSLLNKILGKERVLGLHVDNGLMRKNESATIFKTMKKLGYDNLNIVDARDRFIEALDGVSEPEEKRKIIGNMFIEVQKTELERMNLDPAKWVLGQGTIYPDTIETGGTKNADTIKTHHNRVPIIEKMITEGKVIEPLKLLYKDEVRFLGEKIGLKKELVWRHPFPGPGLGVRILCSTVENQSILSHEKIDLIASSFGFSANILKLKSVGVQGDNRTYRHPVVVKGKCDWEKLNNLSIRLTNEISDINRVIYLCSDSNDKDFGLHKKLMTKERINLLQQADNIVTQIMQDEKIYDEIWQMPVALIPIGESGESIVLRPVVSQEAMTADFYKMNKRILDLMVKDIMKIEGIEHVFYDITNKPPGTIEWE